MNPTPFGAEIPGCRFWFRATCGCHAAIGVVGESRFERDYTVNRPPIWRTYKSERTRGGCWFGYVRSPVARKIRTNIYRELCMLVQIPRESVSEILIWYHLVSYVAPPC